MTASRFGSPEVRYGIIARTALGVGLEDCAREAEVGYETLRSWLKRGRAEQGTEHAAFAAALNEARALAVRPDEDAMTNVCPEVHQRRTRTSRPSPRGSPPRSRLARSHG